MRSWKPPFFASRMHRKVCEKIDAGLGDKYELMMSPWFHWLFKRFGKPTGKFEPEEWQSVLHLKSTKTEMLMRIDRGFWFGTYYFRKAK